MKIFKLIKLMFIIGIILLIITAIIGFIWVIDKIIPGIGSSGEGSSGGSSSVNSAEIKKIMAMSDAEVWKALTGGVLSGIPEVAPANMAEIEAAVRAKIVDITVPIRTWENPGDSSNMKKTSKDVTLQVNELLADLWKAFFTDVYNEDPDFVMASYGCFRIDGTGYGQIGFRSAHTYGAAIDLNWYEDGNPYGNQQPYTKAEWQKLPENHLKYQIIYQDSPIVKIAHKYTLLWGGEWSGSTKDIMHFSFICDGKTRAERIQMFS